MKTIFVLLLALSAFNSRAQITKVSLTASGLTCSMCSKAIYKALLKLPSVEKVDADIERSAYHISFKPDAKIVLEELRKAVQDAGFSLASFTINANFENEEVTSGQKVTISGNQIAFIVDRKQTLKGEKTLLVIDKGYLSEKDQRKYKKIDQSTLSTETGNTIYHVVLQQS